MDLAPLKRLVKHGFARLGLDVRRLRASPRQVSSFPPRERRCLERFPQLALRVLQYGDADLAARCRAHAFVARWLGTAEAAAAVRPTSASASPTPRRIWIYWAQGFKHAPAVVQACRMQWQAISPDIPVVEIDDATLAEHVDVPAAVRHALAANPTHFSDVVRCLLLRDQGGIWADATVWNARPLSSLLEQTPARFFAYSRTDHFLLSSWFLAAGPGTVIPVLMSGALVRWWTDHDELPAYYWLHYLFEALVHLHAGFREEWAARYVQSSHEAHTLHTRLHDPFEPLIFGEILHGTHVQKLTYKTRPAAPGTYLDRLVHPTDTGRA